MNKFIAPKYGEILTKKEWVVYTYLVSKAHFVDQTSVSIKRGQLQFKSVDLAWLMSESYVRKILEYLIERKLIHRTNYKNVKNNGSLITICNYDEVCQLFVRDRDELQYKKVRNKSENSANRRKTKDSDIFDEISTFENDSARSSRDHCDESAKLVRKECESSYIENKTNSIIKQNKEFRIINNSSENTPDVVLTDVSKNTKEVKTKPPSKTAAIYSAYREAIKKRYDIELSPQGGADVRKILANLVDEYDEQKAILMVKAYVNLRDEFLEKNNHHIKFIGSKINVVLKEAANVKAEEEIPQKWCPYREKMVNRTKHIINGEVIWE